MGRPDPVRVLVIGDPYMPLSAYAEPLARLGAEVDVTSIQIEEVASAPPRTTSEQRLREYVGDPADVARAVAGHDVLIVHGAPVSSEVLDGPRPGARSTPGCSASPKTACSARCGGRRAPSGGS